MRIQLSSFDIYYIVQEMQEILDSRVDKTYHKKDELIIQLYNSKIKKFYLNFILPGLMFLTSKKLNTSDSADGFTVILRKRLKGCRIKEISQISFERIVKVVFENNDRTYNLYIELFSSGNFIFCDNNDKIVCFEKSFNSKERFIRGGVKYKPLVKDFNPISINLDEFIDKYRKSKKDSIITFLAIDLGFGGEYGEEICKRCGIDKNSSNLDESKLKKVFEVIKSLKNIKINPFENNNKIYPIFFYNIKEKNPLEGKFSFLIGEQYFKVNKEKQKINIEKKSIKGLSKNEKILDKQRSKLKDLESDIELNQKKGEIIYQNYQKIHEILKTINDANKKYSYDEIEKKLLDKGIIKKLNKKEKDILIDL